MNFSIFSDDETMGLSNSREVVLRGTTTVNRLFNSSAFNIDGWIKTALENAGFAVNAVRYSWVSSILNNAANIEIEINLYNNHTSNEARANAVKAIESFTANYGMNKAFSNTTLSVISDAYQAPGSNPRPNTNQNPPSSYDNTGGQSVGSSGGINPFNFGTALGVTTPIALVGGGLLLLLILKR